MLHFAVIGCPVSHSLSPEVYAPLFASHGVEADFKRMLVVPAELPRIRELTAGLSGFAVTMPHKRSIIPYLDSLSKSASACGAVNIVERRGSELIGHNTDGDGLADALCAAGAAISGSRVLILGRGGAAVSAAHALKDRGAQVRLLVRTQSPDPAFDELLISDLSLAPSCDIFINATPLGMKGRPEFDRFDILDSASPSFVFDMVYRPRGSTALTAEAERRGLVAIDGRAMLKAQALRAFAVWFGVDP